MVSRISDSPKVRLYGFAPLETTSIKGFSPLSHSLPATTTSLRFKSPDTLCLFALAASCTATYASSAFRFATSLSAVKPANRDDVLRGNISSLIFLTTGFFLCELALLFEGFGADFGPSPAEDASSASCFRSLSRFAILACLCCSYSLNSTGAMA